MRFYAKLILLTAAFIGLSSAAMRGVASEAAYLVRVKYVLAFGSEGDLQALVDDTQRALAARSGRLDVYEAGKRYRALLDRRLADAARRNVPLTEEEVEALESACAREAFGGVLDAQRPASNKGCRRQPVPAEHAQTSQFPPSAAR
jgi:hypothetical protein